MATVEFWIQIEAIRGMSRRRQYRSADRADHAADHRASAGPKNLDFHR